LRQTPPALSQARPVSAADLVAGFGRKSASIGSISSPSLVAPSASRPDLRAEAASTSSTNPQDFLLKLLNSQAKTETFSPSRPIDFYSKPNTTNDENINNTSTTVDISASSSSVQPTENIPFATNPLENRDPITASTATQSFAPQLRVFGESSAQAATLTSSHRPSPGLFTSANPFDLFPPVKPVQTSTAAESKSQAQGPSEPQSVHSKATFLKSATPQQHTPQESPKVPTSPPILTRSQNAPETVSEAVGEVGEKVEKQVEEALAQLHLDFPKSSKSAGKKKVKRAPISDEMNEPSSDNPQVYETWEAAAEAEAGDHGIVKIFNLPMKPFISIDIQRLDNSPQIIPAAAILHCVRSRKEFDQVDRNLVAFTSKYIIYAMKDKGFRVVDHETAKWKLQFPQSDERIFNITLSIDKSTSTSADQRNCAVLATGVKGTVFWSKFVRFDQSLSDESTGFILPAVESGEEHTSNSQLKTRVRASSRNPAFFAYGRGKFIHIIRPLLASMAPFTDPETEILDTQKYLTCDNLKICTGKAAKDFAFSSDDTVIASLDKAGKLKFWDVQALTERPADETGAHHEVKSPIMSLNACIKSEKAWPTSVMFIDKEKPMNNGLALRYMFVGMKQNHTLQLWDLGLGQQVQEINFPHSDESDAICSLAFNTKLSMLVVGHPTRNSIYLLHVSPPKYGLQPMSQARYMNMLATKDKALPSLASTVIVGSIREYTLNNIGSLRSLDLMMDSPMTEDGTTDKDYIMTIICYHSKGIFEFTVTRELVGWSKDGKSLNSVDAIEGENIKTKSLVQPSQDDTVSTNGESVSANGTTSKSEDASKSSTESTNVAQTSPEKKRDRRKKTADAASSSKAPSKSGLSSELPENPRQQSDTVPTNATPANYMPSGNDDTNVPRMEKRIVSSFDRIISERLTLLQNRLDDDHRASEAAAAAKEDAVMKHISHAFPQNVEKTLKAVVAKSLAETVDSIKETVTNTVDRSVTTAFANAIKNALPREIEKMAPAITNKLAQDQTLIRSLSAGVAKEVTGTVLRDFQRGLQEIAPAIEVATLKSSVQAVNGLEQRITAQMQVYEARRLADATKIDELNAHVNNLNAALRELVEQQAKFKSEVMAQFNGQRQPVGGSTNTLIEPFAAPAAENPLSQEPEIVALRTLMDQYRSEDAFVQVSL
jgi:hypothetical protein